MDKPFEIVSRSISHDTVDALEELLKEARRGEVIGVAFAVMYSGRDYAVNATGEAYRSPTFTRGMIQALDDRMKSRLYRHE